MTRKDEPTTERPQDGYSEKIAGIDPLNPGKPTANLVLKLASMGLDENQIAAVFGMWPKHITTTFPRALARGKTFRNAFVAVRQYDIATGKVRGTTAQTAMAIWIGKNRLNQSEKSNITVDHKYDPESVAQEIAKVFTGKPTKKDKDKILPIEAVG